MKKCDDTQKHIVYGWINIYQSESQDDTYLLSHRVWNTKEEAIDYAKRVSREPLATIQIEFQITK